MSVRAKFRVESISPNIANDADFANGGSVVLRPVTGGSAENDSFYYQTPGGMVQLSTINQNAIKEFEVGKEYYVDFTRAEEK